jgi:peptidoglycan hydrolase-like protein with peptidoglycan-binding domain
MHNIKLFAEIIQNVKIIFYLCIEILNKDKMNYPKRVITKGELNSVIVKAIQKRLNQLGCGPLEEDGIFGQKTFAAVKNFQVRFSDNLGNPLKPDGIVGSITWAVLFGENTVAAEEKPENTFLQKVIEIASGEVGKMEEPIGSNKGKHVERYQKTVGIPVGSPWCMAFVYWCFNEACNIHNRMNVLVKTGSVLEHWNKSEAKKITSLQAIENPSLVKPGHIFIISTGGGTGHTGIVESVHGGFLTTIEGNTNIGGSREGIGVFRRKSRNINNINKGFLEYV